MSISETHAPVVGADQDRRANDRGDIAADPSARPADSGEVTGRYVDEVLVQGDRVAVEQLIAHVLCRAHRMAEALGAPNEARAILQVAHAFADELAAMNPGFDRMRFIDAVTSDPS
jgi:hypothetical protein